LILNAIVVYNVNDGYVVVLAPTTDSLE